MLKRGAGDSGGWAAESCRGQTIQGLMGAAETSALERDGMSPESSEG